MDWLARARSVSEEVVSLRRDLHAHPEPSFEERRTSEVVAKRLEALGLRPRRVGATGVLADLEVPGAPRRIALRADMDALRMPDGCATPWASRNEGVAHACGHDAHTAMLLGAASLLAGEKPRLRSSVRFLFQHAEERFPGGAIDFVKEGALEGVAAVYGLHVLGDLEAGQVSATAGSVLASADEFAIRLRGRGGHAAAPHLARDPIPPAAELVGALQTIVSRRTDPFTPAAVSVCSFHGGTAFNVIPEVVELLGTARALDPALRESLEAWIRETAEGIAAAHGLAAEIAYERGYPVTVNDREEVEKVRAVAAALFGEGAVVREPRRVLGAEDFSRYLERVPGAFVFLGTRNEAAGIRAPNHHPAFGVDEGVLSSGVALLCALVEPPGRAS